MSGWTAGRRIVGSTADLEDDSILELHPGILG